MRGHFEAAGGKNLERFFRQWIRAKGAPELELTGAAYENFQNEYRIALTVSQKQERPLYHMTLPVAVWVEGSDKPHLENLILKSQPKQTLRLFVPGQPRAVMLDPYYDVFRKLDPRETPPSIGQTYGADKAVAVISRQEEPSLRQAYTRFVEGLRTPATLTNKAGNWKSPNTSLWLFGRDNPAARDLQPGLKDFGVSLADDGVTIEGKKFPWQEHSFMFTLPHPNNPGRTATWIIADNPPSVPGLMRKLPHYGKYGVLVFKGNAPTNVYKNTWPARRIGLMKMFKEGKYKFPKRPPLVDFKPE
ncbi:MAG: hypothetical protein GWM98_27795 [Nitrospinaceae bacterium]|nr:hypothetical protein [Nitrospinaceae bacterium]NIR57564.1 hypothetical protein [Nitrospinaceae bacterium]NIS88034.1 hypothetical protein [Nitrospinaceae bacterium]NIT84898.1 hypothetical protein [Nitrospinaceae bacterium]NIU47074.1 hypothetical protein [Nitrospinaceae bacterium]